MIQVWTAMIALLLVEYFRFICKSSFSLQQAFRILKDNLFQHYRVETLLGDIIRPKPIDCKNLDLQLSLCF